MGKVSVIMNGVNIIRKVLVRIESFIVIFDWLFGVKLLVELMLKIIFI